MVRIKFSDMQCNDSGCLIYLSPGAGVTLPTMSSSGRTPPVLPLPSCRRPCRLGATAEQSPSRWFGDSAGIVGATNPPDGVSGNCKRGRRGISTLFHRRRRCALSRLCRLRTSSRLWRCRRVYSSEMGSCHCCSA